MSGNDGRVNMVIAICLVLAVAAITAGVVLGTGHARSATEKERVACSQAGGTWPYPYNSNNGCSIKTH